MESKFYSKHAPISEQYLTIVLCKSRKKQPAKAQPAAQIDEQDRASSGGIIQAADTLIPLAQISDESGNSAEEDNGVSLSDAMLVHDWPNLINSVSYHGDLAASALDAPDDSPHEASTKIPLPSYIKTPRKMEPDDLQFLWYKGALRIPDTSFKNALLRSYIEYVHPSLPLINLHEFLAISCATKSGQYGEDRRISLLLFQAVLFAGSAFVDDMTLQMAGYSTRREARAAFYQKVKVRAQFIS